MKAQEFCPTKENLYYEYCVLGKSMKDIAREYGSSRTIISTQLKEDGIPIHSGVEAHNMPTYTIKLKQFTKGNKSFLGHHHTEEWKQQRSRCMQGNTYGKNGKGRTGQPFTLEEQEADRQGQLRRYINPLEREKTSLAMKKYYREHPEAKERQRQQLLKCNHKCSVEKATHISKSHEKLWQSPKHIAKLIASFHRKPTRPELRLQEILNSHFSDFKYNGDFRLGIVLGGMIPDFVNVNGKKEVIEVFGSYWHSPKVTHRWKASELGKVMLYNSLGYKCLIIWEHELKNTENTIAKIGQFTRGNGGNLEDSLRRMKHTI